MPRKISRKVEKHVLIKDLETMLKSEKDSRILDKLIFIRHLYYGLSVIKACEKVGHSNASGYEWLKRWNESGYDGFKMKKSPGRPRKLTKIEEKEIKKIINGKLTPDINMRIDEVADIIENKYGVVYSYKRLVEVVKEWGYIYHSQEILKHSSLGRFTLIASDF